MAPTDEILDPGPDVRGGVEFVTIRHPDVGTASVPVSTVGHWKSRGWEEFDAPTPAELAETAASVSTKMKRAQLDRIARDLGVVDPEDFASKDEVIEAIEALSPLADPTPPPSPDGLTTSQED